MFWQNEHTQKKTPTTIINAFSLYSMRNMFKVFFVVVGLNSEIFAKKEK